MTDSGAPAGARALADQYDLRHALAVASRVDGLDAKLTALLHDAVEDGACSFEDLRDADLPESVTLAVSTLTRAAGEPYGDYIARIRDSRNELAIYVKAADLETNLARMDEEHSSLAGRYHKALRDLVQPATAPKPSPQKASAQDSEAGSA